MAEILLSYLNLKIYSALRNMKNIFIIKLQKKILINPSFMSIFRKNRKSFTSAQKIKVLITKYVCYLV